MSTEGMTGAAITLMPGARPTLEPRRAIHEPRLMIAPRRASLTACRRQSSLPRGGHPFSDRGCHGGPGAGPWRRWDEPGRHRG